MRMQKNEERKKQIVEFVKENCEIQGWGQDQNADAICRRVLSLAKKSGVDGGVLKAFALELIADLTTSGLGLYGNASQMRQTLLGKDGGKEEKASDVNSLLAGYDIE